MKRADALTRSRAIFSSGQAKTAGSAKMTLRPRGRVLLDTNRHADRHLIRRVQDPRQLQNKVLLKLTARPDAGMRRGNSIWARATSPTAHSRGPATVTGLPPNALDRDRVRLEGCAQLRLAQGGRGLLVLGRRGRAQAVIGQRAGKTRCPPSPPRLRGQRRPRALFAKTDAHLRTNASGRGCGAPTFRSCFATSRARNLSCLRAFTPAASVFCGPGRPAPPAPRPKPSRACPPDRVGDDRWPRSRTDAAELAIVMLSLVHRADPFLRSRRGRHPPARELLALLRPLPAPILHPDRARPGDRAARVAASRLCQLPQPGIHARRRSRTTRIQENLHGPAGHADRSRSSPSRSRR